MAQNITLLGASYSAVPAVQLPKTGGGTATFTDVSDTTAAAADVAQGKYFYTAAGVRTQGTSSGGGGGAIAVTDVTLPNGGIEKQITAVDISSDTVTAAHLETGYTAHDAQGNAITGTLSPSSPSYQSKTVTPTTSQQVVTADQGYDALSQVTVSAMPSGSAGTPTATKGSVSNHSVTVTPSVTNTTGYITGGTKTGTAVTVSASELVSGSQTVTQNGTVDVTNLASVTINVSGGGGKAIQHYNGSDFVKSASYEATDVSLTVAKTGTYNISWVGWRSTTSGTSGSQLYKNGSALGSAVTSFTGTYGQRVSQSNVSLNAEDVLVVYARARGTQYFMYVSDLIIEEV